MQPEQLPLEWIANTTFDGTATLTQGPIIVTFIGTLSTRQPQCISTKIEIIELIIASQDPKCTSSSPQAAAATSPSTVSTLARGTTRGRMGVAELAYHNTSLLVRPHVLLMSPASPTSLIELDYIIYTYADVPTNKPRIGAIVGSAIGGVVALTLLGIGAFFLRRQDQRRTIAARGMRLGEGGGGEQDKSSVIKLSMMQQMSGEKSEL
ncbi:hypothetical protein B0H14DRAFT_2722282 [Mycena olivaceomarginata]|nr:hypothetical protein B0H14DRAFT_2722282 [Mycena olivaceomarginata]